MARGIISLPLCKWFFCRALRQIDGRAPRSGTQFCSEGGTHISQGSVLAEINQITGGADKHGE